MMREALETILRWAVYGGLALMSAGVLAYVAFVAWRTGKDALRRVRAARAGLLALAAFATLYGGGKGFSLLSRLGHDDAAPYNAIVSFDCYANGAYTNVAELAGEGWGTNVEVFVIGSTAGSAKGNVWYRDSDYEDWTSLLDVTAGGGVFVRGTTNFTYYVFADTNRFDRAGRQYWYGVNLPPKIVADEGGVELVSLAPTSTNLTLRVAVDGSKVTPGVTTLEFDRAWWDGHGFGEWETVHSEAAAGGTNDVTLAGFFVQRRSRWRVRLNTEESE